VSGDVLPGLKLVSGEGLCLKSWGRTSSQGGTQAAKKILSAGSQNKRKRGAPSKKRMTLGGRHILKRKRGYFDPTKEYILSLKEDFGEGLAHLGDGRSLGEYVLGGGSYIVTKSFHSLPIKLKLKKGNTAIIPSGFSLKEILRNEDVGLNHVS